MVRDNLGGVAPLLDFQFGERLRLRDGAAFILDEIVSPPPVWGDGDDSLWSPGEPLMIVGPEGVGKTALMQQLALARIGLRPNLLGYTVKPDDKQVLYIAADRPRQVARSFRRMVSADDADLLKEKLLVWEGPLPFDLAELPSNFAEWALSLGVATIFVDSLKDVALDLSKDETGSRVNLAHQAVIAAGIELCSGHHQRKQQSDRPPNKISDVYGSRWLTAGMGSVVLIWGQPGDIVVELPT